MARIDDNSAYDVVVIGGGFFGARLAHHAAKVHRHRTLLIDSADRLLTRASYANQARIHNGYHYPRSIVTAMRSAANFPRFQAEFPEAVTDDFEKFYGVARIGSNVTAQQFEIFAHRIGAPIEDAPEDVGRLFDQGRLERLFRVKETAFNALALAERVGRDMDAAGVERLQPAEARRVRREAGGIVLDVGRAGAPDITLRARRVFNCTYSRTNRLLAASGIELVPLKHEIAELCLVEPTPEISGRGFTIMCGPFFSIMPFPARGLYSFSHVRYTPHGSWQDATAADYRDPYDVLGAYAKVTRFENMRRDAGRIMPAILGVRYVDSLFEVKTVLPRSEVDDGRPILYRRHRDMPGLISVLGAKIDNIYDMIAFADDDLRGDS